MKKFLQLMSLVALMLVPWAIQAQNFSYTCDFEDDSDTTGWVILNGSCTNGWYIDTAVACTGSKSLYISSDNGVTNAYTTSSSSLGVYAYREVVLTNTAAYDISFDWRAYGEGSYDYIRVFLVPSTVTLTPGTLPNSLTSMYDFVSVVPDGWIQLTSASKLNLSSTWQHYLNSVSVPAGTYNLVFFWGNDGSGGTQPPAAVDNISFVEPTCPYPGNLAVSNITSSSADLNWVERGTASSWVIEYDTANFIPGAGTGNIVNVSDTTATLTDLLDHTTYYVYLHSDCGGGDTSINIQTSFTTRYICSPLDEYEVTGRSATSATLSWTYQAGVGDNDPSTVEITWSDSTGQIGTATVTDYSTYVITGLSAFTDYTATITPYCEGDSSSTVTLEFTTMPLPCAVWDTTLTDTAVIGTGTSQTSGVPVNSGWGNTLCQGIYTASELVAAGLDSNGCGITDLVFTWTTSSSYNKVFTIWLAQTTTSTFAGTAASNWIPANAFTQVYTGDHNIGTTGSVTYHLDVPFQWDGSSNIVVMTTMNQPANASHISSGFYGLSSAGSAYRSMYKYQDSNPLTLAALANGASSRSQNRTNISFISNVCAEYSECAAPTLSILSVLPDSVAIQWTPGYQETSWDVAYRLHGNSEWTMVEIGTSNTTYIFENLIPATEYDFMVMHECDGDTLMDMETVRTACAPIATFPFTENFESYSTGSSATINPCWFKYYWNGSTLNPSNYPYPTTVGGSKAMYFYSYLSGTSTRYYSWLALPEVLDSVQPLEMDFDIRRYTTGTNYTQQLIVGVMSDPNDLTTFDTVQVVEAFASGIWEAQSVSFANYTGTGKHIAFLSPNVPIAGSTYSYNYIYLDNIVLDRSSSCPRITRVHARDITNTEADITWDRNENYASVIVKWGTSSSVADVIDSVEVFDNIVTLTNLNPSTTYYVWAQAMCSDEPSRVGFCNFTTAATCNNVVSATIYDVTNNSATLSWEPNQVTVPTAFVIDYKADTVDTWTTTVTNENYYFITGLDEGVTYNVRIRSVCGNDTSTAATGSFETSVTGTIGSNQDYAVVPIYPLYNYSISEQIYPASEFAGYGDTITGIYFYSAGATVDAPRDLKCYVGNTTRAAFTSEADFISSADLTLVYDSTWNITQGWVELPFATPFVRNNAQNFVILMVDETGEYEDFEGFAYYETTDNVAMFGYNDNNAYSTTTGSGLDMAAARNMIRLNASYSTPTCYAPHIAVANAGGTQIGLIWRHGANETSWTVDYRLLSDTVWTPVVATTTDTFATVSNLTPSSQYVFRVGSICGTDIVYGTIRANTSCGAYAVPYTENFDLLDAGATTINPCWHTGAAFGTSRPSVINLTSLGKMLHLPVGTYATLPLMAEDVNQLRVRFDFMVADTNIYGIVGVSNHPNDVFAVQYFDTVYADANGMASYFRVPFGAYEDSVGYITFFSPRGSIYIDNVIVETIPPCDMVDSLTAINITDNGTDLTWLATPNATSYIVEYGPFGFELGTGTTVTTENATVSLTGLDHSTTYQAYLYTVCSSFPDTSVASYPVTFTTECAAVTTLPYVMNFDMAYVPPLTETRIMPNCWSHVMTGTGSYTMGSYLPQIYVSSSYVASAPACLRLYGNTVTLLPEMPTDLDSLQLSFYEYNTSIGYYGLVIGVCDSNTPGFEQSFTPVDTIHYTASRDNYTVYFAGYQGTGRYIAFKNFYVNSTTSYSYHYIDDVVVDYAPSCLPVQNIRCAATTPTTVDLAWTDLRPASEWQVVYATAPLTDSTMHLGTSAIATTNPYTINGLNDSTTYYFYVRTICAPGDTSTWNRRQFSIRPGTYVMRSGVTDTISMCDGTIYDNGGENGAYGASQDNILIIMPSMADHIVSLSGTYSTESCCDELYIYDGIGINGTELGNYAGGGSFTDIVGTDPSGALTLYFESDGSVQQDGFEINVNCIYTGCRTLNVRIDTTQPQMTNSLAVTWDNEASNFEIEYGPMGFEQGYGNLLTSNTNSVTITNLTASTFYDVYVRGICSGTDTGSWAMATLSTAMCDNLQYVTNADSTLTSTTTTYFPGYSFYDYSYNEVIIDSADLADLAGDVVGLAFKPTTTNAGSFFTNCDIYMANTTQTNLSSGFIQDTATFVLVYSGDISYSDTEWRIVQFQNHFTWDGTSNVVVAVNRKHGDYESGATFLAHNSGVTGKGRYVQRDGTVYTFGSITGGTSVTTVPDYRLFSCGSSCTTPVISNISQDYANITIEWAGDSTTYEVAVKEASAGAWPTETPVVGTRYTFTSLNPATEYTVRVRRDCDSLGYSNWAERNITTDSLPCFAPTDLQVTATGYGTVTLDWTIGSVETEWVVNVFRSDANIMDTVSAHPATISGLYAGMEYSASVQAKCGGGAIYSDWSDTITFTTNVCEPVTDVAVSEITSSSVKVDWTPAAGSNAWQISYGEMDFTEGQGSVIDVNAHPYVVNGLESNFYYDVYVRTKCDESSYSVWSSVVQFQTTSEGIADIDGADINIYPNPTSGNTTISVSGANGLVKVEIVDINGRTVVSESMECTGDCVKKMDVNDLAQGAYFVRITGENVNAVKKLIVR